MEIQLTKTKLSEELFSPLFGTWWSRVRPFFLSGGFDDIYKRLKSDSARGKQIAPLSSHVFRCFQETPLDEVRAVLCGMAPYHTFYNNVPIADGLLMSCSITGRLQPSLIKFYDSMDRSVNGGLNLQMVRDPDLSYLSRQGILMLNSSLSTEKGKPGNHAEIWEPFMKFLFEEVLITNGIPVVFLGREAAKLKRYVTPFTWIFELVHPAAAAYASSDWNEEDIFNKINRILKENNGDTIQWIKTDL